MNAVQLRPVLEGEKALVIGIANEDSIAYGCAKAFRSLGADLAISWLNDKARRFVEPLAQELQASITGEVDVSIPGQLEAIFEQIRDTVGKAGHSRPFDRLCAQGRSPGRPSRLFRRRLCQGDGRILPFLRKDG